MIAVGENKINTSPSLPLLRGGAMGFVLLVLLSIPLVLFWPRQTNWQILIGLAVVLGLIILFRLYKKWPFILIFIVLPAIVVGPIAVLTVRDYSYEISLAEILILAAYMIFFIDKLGRKKMNLRIGQVGWAFLGFVFLSILSLLWADNLSRGLIAIRVFGYHFLVLFLVANIIKTKKDFYRALWALPVTAFLAAVQLFYKVLCLGGFNTVFIPDRTQIITPVGSWVFISAIIVLCIPLSCVLLVSQGFRRQQTVLQKYNFFSVGWLVKTKKLPVKKWQRYPILFFMIIFSVLTSIFTLGKGEILSLAAGLGYFFKKQKTQKWLVILIIALVLVLLVVFFAQFGSQFWQRILNTFSDHNTRFRIEEFKTGLRVFASHPLFGVGAGNLKLVYRQALPWFVETESNNIIIQILAELGIIGLIVAGFLVKSIIGVFKKPPLSLPLSKGERIIRLGFQSTMIVAVVNSLVEVTFIGLNYGIIFWYIVGLLVSWRQLMYKTKS